MNHEKSTGKQRQRRCFRVRNRVKKDATRPRLSVYRSLKHMYAQVIDEAGKVLAVASTLDKELEKSMKYGGNKDAAKMVGVLVAKRALASGVKEVALDRREYKYHGRVAALAEGAREGGLSF